jgi:Cu(I)/Ag(I) efflux system membrane fusion protein
MIALAVLGACLSFGAGVWYASSRNPGAPAAGARRVLYYQDPMHPAYRSDNPGIAPDCGMQLEPVYADGGASGPSGAARPAGTVEISAERRQMIGIRSEEARMASAAEPLRVLGRVVADESRTYRINAAVDGWIREISAEATTSSFVRKYDVLASYYAPEFLAAQQAYLFALGAIDRFQATGQETEAQIKLTNANIQQAKNSLTVLGMTDHQAAEIVKTRELTERVRVEAPTDGFILARNVSPGQRFDRGTEFFRIADLSRVWVLADLFENEASLVKSVNSATVRYGGRSYQGRVSRVPPVFDGASRTLKLRLEVENAGLTLRPDMFVDVELPLHLPGALTVPADAVLDSGRRIIVYIDRGNGIFEPRQVETGWCYGNRVAIIRGLNAGERVATGATFLLDSESRLQLTSQGPTPAPEDRDPVCGMIVKSSTHSATYRGRTYRFCSPSCKRDFEAHPDRFAKGGEHD